MAHTAIPEDELRVFDSLQDVRVVIDVGARDDIDYVLRKPNIELHSFEPYLPFFEELKNAATPYPNIHINNCALSDFRGWVPYSEGRQAIDGGFGGEVKSDILVRTETLDDYVKDNDIEKIDFLKIDTEGHELKVLLGGKESIKKCRYIQYERYEKPEDERVEELLTDFDFYYTGYRNVICVRKGEPRPWIPEVPQEGALTLKP